MSAPRDLPFLGLPLGTRFFLGAIALLGMSLGPALVIANRKARSVAEERILSDLTNGPAICQGYFETEARTRRAQVRSLAEEPGTKALLAEAAASGETFRDSAGDFARGLGARTVFLFDPRGILLGRNDRPPTREAGRDFSQVSWVETPLMRLSEASAHILELKGGPTLSTVASAPVLQGSGSELRLNGVIAATFPLGSEGILEISRLTRGEVALLANVAPRDAAPEMKVTGSTSLLAGDALAGKVMSAPGVMDALFRKVEPIGPVEFSLGSEVYVGTLIPIRSGGEEPLGGLVVARSKSAEMASFGQITRHLLLTGLLVLVASLPLSYLLAWRLTRPLRLLAEGAHRIGEGDLDVSLPEAGGEVGALTRAFSSMLKELREKAALEALVAEMQRRPGDITWGSGEPPPGDGSSGLQVGGVFANRYEILSVLGEGGMGTVYRVRDRGLDDEIALKALKPQAEDASSVVERLRHEIKLARMITHPNVVRAHDFGESGGVQFLTMEYVPGTTLRELLNLYRDGLGLVPALQIAKQICRGLGAVHRAGIVHGDLKPTNVMVMGSGIAKLMDFGVARVRMTEEPGGWLAGTPLYMSPEQARGGEVDERSDLYSAGVVFFEMFTGRCPFRGSDADEILEKHLNDPPPDPRSMRRDLPESLAQIILLCLGKQRLERPGSAGELDRMLMRVRP